MKTLLNHNVIQAGPNVLSMQYEVQINMIAIINLYDNNYYQLFLNSLIYNYRNSLVENINNKFWKLLGETHVFNLFSNLVMA